MTFLLVKCKQNHPNSEMVSCDFNTKHIVHKLELYRHHLHCENRNNFVVKNAETLWKAHNTYIIPTIEIATVRGNV